MAAATAADTDPATAADTCAVQECHLQTSCFKPDMTRALSPILLCPKNLQSEIVMDFVIFCFALPFLVIGSAGEPQTPMSAALLCTAAWSCSAAPCKLMGK